MPIVVDEVIISVEINNQEAGGAAPEPAGTQDRQALVQECVERVLEVLREKAER
jgi:hypothetical protein